MPLPSSWETVSETLLSELAAAAVRGRPQVGHPPGELDGGSVIGAIGLGPVIGGRVAGGSGCRARQTELLRRKMRRVGAARERVADREARGELARSTARAGGSSSASESPTLNGPPDCVSNPPVIVSRTSNSAIGRGDRVREAEFLGLGRQQAAVVSRATH